MEKTISPTTEVKSTSPLPLCGILKEELQSIHGVNLAKEYLCWMAGIADNRDLFHKDQIREAERLGGSPFFCRLRDRENPFSKSILQKADEQFRSLVLDTEPLHQDR